MGKKVLIVDDEPNIVAALEFLLEKNGYDVQAAANGVDALEQLDASMHALGLTLDDAAMARLDEIWPGPGGPAPEAYAW